MCAAKIKAVKPCRQQWPKVETGWNLMEQSTGLQCPVRRENAAETGSKIAQILVPMPRFHYLCSHEKLTPKKYICNDEQLV